MYQQRNKIQTRQVKCDGEPDTHLLLTWIIERFFFFCLDSLYFYFIPLFYSLFSAFSDSFTFRHSLSLESPKTLLSISESSPIKR